MDATHKGFADRVRAQMQTRGLSVNKLADFAGLGRGTVSDVLRGKQSPSLATMQKIADALDIRLRDLL
jgi:transcriptional regulator with XRE-family HTH domain